MTTIAIRDATGTQVAVEAPLAPGRVAAAASRPITLSTEDLAALNGVTTAINNLLAKLPTALGGGGGLKIDGSGTALPVSGTVSLTDISNAEYETVAASQTSQIMGSTGATGDYLGGVLVVPASTSPGAVTVTDGAANIIVFTGGPSSVSNLVPFFIPLGIKSTTGAWRITTGANVSAIGMGNFT